MEMIRNENKLNEIELELNRKNEKKVLNKIKTVAIVLILS